MTLDRKNKYDAWKADKIRTRLNNYRTDKAVGTDPLSLRIVMERIADCPTLDPVLLTRQRKLKFPEEWLRRFTVNKAGLWFDRVNALRVFLIFEGYLSDEELNDDLGDQGEMLAIYSYLASSVDAGRKRMGQLPDPYIVRSVFTFGDEQIELTFTKRADEPLFTVEETWLLEQTALAQIKGVKDVSKTRLRKGYAFFSTRMNLLHVYLRGGSPQDRVNYVQVEPCVSPEGSGDLFLVRLGMPWRRGDSVFREPSFRGGMLTPDNCGVRKFEPVSSSPSPRSRH